MFFVAGKGVTLRRPFTYYMASTQLSLTILTFSADSVVSSVGGTIAIEIESGEKRIKRGKRRMRKDGSRRTGLDEGDSLPIIILCARACVGGATPCVI